MDDNFTILIIVVVFVGVRGEKRMGLVKVWKDPIVKGFLNHLMPFFWNCQLQGFFQKFGEIISKLFWLSSNLLIRQYLCNTFMCPLRRGSSIDFLLTNRQASTGVFANKVKLIQIHLLKEDNFAVVLFFNFYEFIFVYLRCWNIRAVYEELFFAQSK